MIRIRVLALALALASPVLLAPAGSPTSAPAALPGSNPPDSALDEMRVGRFWHAARILREAEAHLGRPEDVLLLARAEAGWKNWPAVADLLGSAEWLDEKGDGEGWRLLGRALEDAGDWRGAADAYARLLAHVGASDGRRGSILARQARCEMRAGNPVGSLDALDGIGVREGFLRSWMAVHLAEPAVQAGDSALTSELLRRVSDQGARDASWQFGPRVLLAAGDSVAAVAAYREVGEGASGARRAAAAVEVGLLALALGDTATARDLLAAHVDEAPGRSETRAAAALMDLGAGDLAFTLRLARHLDRSGDGRRALLGYDRAHRLAGAAGAALGESDRLSRARLMATVRSRQDAALEEFRALRESTEDERTGARTLEAWAGMRSRQGLSDHVATLRRWLLEEYPGSPEAAEVVWSRASAADARGDVSTALRLYSDVAEQARTHARAGQARMRTGQIHIGAGRSAEAVVVYEAYLRDFPEGRRWDEAAYWAARSRLDTGDTVSARAHLARVWEEEPVSYYAVMGAELLGVTYDVEAPDGAEPVEPGWLKEGLRRLDALADAGLEEGAAEEEGRLVARSRRSAPAMLRLGEELNARGRTITGINLGWDLRGEGHPWDQRLLRVVYPFLYRELVIREASEWGVDPIMLAAIIRQESAFKADIVSHAGAIGLMQVMPPTGRELARAHGPDGFRPDNLTTPEVNLHLGTAFFVDMSRRYDDQLPLVLSAYNAGPTRATRWRRYPEAADPLRFTERIPFDETRGYVKNVRRNLGLYQVLYGVD